jgi:hypothetical protein
LGGFLRGKLAAKLTALDHMLDGSAARRAVRRTNRPTGGLDSASDELAGCRPAAEKPRSIGIQRSLAWSPSPGQSDWRRGRPNLFGRRFREKPLKRRFLRRT